MMCERLVEQESLFYGFSFDPHGAELPQPEKWVTFLKNGVSFTPTQKYAIPSPLTKIG